MSAPVVLTIKRVTQNPYATYGRLFGADGQQQCVTLELPWLGNQRGVSCIPAGTYTAERYLSPGHGRVVFRLIDVPHRDEVELHAGCLPRDSKGCVLVGSAFGAVDYGDGRADGKGDGITGAKTAFAAFMANHPEQRFTLTITDPEPA